MRNVNEEVKAYLEKTGDESVNLLRQELTKKKKIATGGTLRSIEREVIERGDVRFNLKVLASEDIAFILGGRKQGLQLPPAEKIEAWAKVKGIKLKGSTKANGLRSLGFQIARGIKKEGIRGVNVRGWAKRKDQEIYEEVQQLLQEIYTENLAEAATEGATGLNIKISK
ncbi:MAG: hypothetical protein J0H29_13265 [Sphingobacteriales bacterium]|nr:hypothetical protein [Sphingobacteriales bacterium]OJY86347.1 MAG: hypothetical protein BGP14_20445 [Sphingobacteriales bacterium 44-15]